MFPKVLTIGEFFLPSYGPLVALGFLAGIWVAMRLARRAGLPAEPLTNLAVYCALVGLAGAKLLMFALDYEYYRQDLGRLVSLDTLASAGVFHGGFLAALAFAAWYVRRHRLPLLNVTDVFAPGLALGHAIGRLGCFTAGCCWGSHCNRPWAVTFTNPDANALVGVPLGDALHPVQLYEAGGMFAVFAAVYRLFGRFARPGALFGVYLVLASAVRFGTEFYRWHQQALPFGGPFTLTQWISLVLLATGICLARPRR
jgi:phosphatidylglycerol:prolipoprotein diacylglycerol transferase